MPMEYTAKTGGMVGGGGHGANVAMFNAEDNTDKEMRMLSRVDRLEKWNAQKQASKSNHH